MKISFVIPALNEERNIVSCIASIREACGSHVGEIIVVDNGSDDATVDLARYAGAVVVPEPNRGVTRARQKGLESAQHQWVAFIDADCRLSAGWFDRLQRNLEGRNVVGVSGPSVYDDLGRFDSFWVATFYRAARLLHLVMPTTHGGNTVMDRRAFLDAGGFDTTIDFYGDDTDTARRLNKLGKVRFDLGMFVHANARRMMAEGLIMTSLRYTGNYLWVWIVGRPLTKTHYDYRT